jgi:DNA processing protein
MASEEDRALALLAGGWVTPERLAKALTGLLQGGGLVLAEPTASNVLDVLEAVAHREGATAPPERVAQVRARLAAAGAVLRVIGGPGYPCALARAWPELGAPLWLAVRSPNGRLPDGPAVAVVGTRQPSLEGLRTAEALGRLLGRHGVVVVSGFARGIDQAAHRGALAAGGRTVAVLGAGFDIDYPRGDGGLREEVADSGGLATELAPDARPLPRHFIARNRIVSGLADAVVVVEGRARSGALATARLGAAQGRDVWAVPGPLRSATSQAPLALIRDGAQVVTRLEDVLEAVLGDQHAQGDGTGSATWDAGGRERDLSPPARAVLALLGGEPARPGALAAAADLPLPAVLASVAELTSRGLAVATVRGLVRG